MNVSKERVNKKGSVITSLVLCIRSLLVIFKNLLMSSSSTTSLLGVLGEKRFPLLGVLTTLVLLFFLGRCCWL